MGTEGHGGPTSTTNNFLLPFVDLGQSGFQSPVLGPSFVVANCHGFVAMVVCLFLQTVGMLSDSGELRGLQFFVERCID